MWLCSDFQMNNFWQIWSSRTSLVSFLCLGEGCVFISTIVNTWWFVLFVSVCRFWWHEQQYLSHFSFSQMSVWDCHFKESVWSVQRGTVFGFFVNLCLQRYSPLTYCSFYAAVLHQFMVSSSLIIVFFSLSPLFFSVLSSLCVSLYLW